MMRIESLRHVGGYNATMIAGEEADLCVRLRERGWKILRVDAEMTLHDAAMTRYGQWWARSVRTGHAYAEGMALHGRGRDRHNVRRVVSALAWGFGSPAVLVVSALATTWEPWSASAIPLLLGSYAVLWMRIYQNRRHRGDRRSDAAVYSIFCMAGKTAEGLGIVKYWMHRLRGRRATLIEYKTGPA